MMRLVSLLYTVISAALAGTGVVIVLAAGFVSVKAIVAAALVGFVLAAPASWLLGRKLYSL